MSRVDVVIVNRSFGPSGQVVGEALLQLSERLALERRVCVITQSDRNLKKELRNGGRAHNVSVMECFSRSDSSSSLIERVYDAFLFMWWTFFCLIWTRPREVYVSTNPPVMVPFVVFVYSKIFGCRYIYHLQDIHPEAANIVVSIRPLVYALFKWIDVVVMRHADKIITLSEDMKEYIIERSGTLASVHVINNPAFSLEVDTEFSSKAGVVFCGNAGRLQLIPLLVESIREYLYQGGALTFTFVGGGVFAPELRKLGEEFPSVSYLGQVSAPDAAQVVRIHQWALLPINDEVTKYAFPSKASSYVLSGCQILAICGKETSVARWVDEWRLGRVCPPQKAPIVELFRELEKLEFAEEYYNAYTRHDRAIVESLSMENFVFSVSRLIG